MVDVFAVSGFINQLPNGRHHFAGMQGGAPKIAKLVNITPKTMVYR